MTNEDEEDQYDKPSYWLDRAANALDYAVQLTGDDYTPQINQMEEVCDGLAKYYKKKGK